MKQVLASPGAVLFLALVSGLWSESNPLRAQQADGRKLAGQAKEILERNCVRCHGTSKAAGLDVRDYKLMLTPTKKRTFLVPKDLKKSKLWEMIESGEMPQDGEMPEAEKKIVKGWIEAGAPAFVAVAAKRPYVSIKQNLTAIRDHLREAEEDDRPYLRYFTTTNLHNNPDITEEQYGRHLGALSKALNSLHWKKPIVLPRQVDKYGTVFVIDLRDLDWDKKEHEKYDRWSILLGRYPYGLGYEDDDALMKIDKEIDTLGRRTLVYLRADWFVAHATRPPLYEQVLRLPRTSYELETRLGVDVLSNFKRNRLARAGYAKSFVSGQNRLVERHDALYGAYWKSYDFKKGGEKCSLVDFPLGPQDFGNGSSVKHAHLDVAFKHDGGEMIFNLPNGLQGYFLTDGKGKYIDRGPVDVVSDNAKTSGTTEIVNGLSCMFCHKKGMIDSVLDEVRMGNSLSGEARQKVKRLYPPRTIMLKYVEEDGEVFLASMKKAAGPFLAGADKGKALGSVEEPVGELVQKYYNPDLTLAVAAYELGYAKPDDLKARIKGNDNLREIGLGTLVAGGMLKREDWDKIDGQSLFQKAASRLGVGSSRRFSFREPSR